MKPRRTTPRKKAHPPPERDVKTNRARRREQFELAERAKRRPQPFPQPEDEGRYRP